MTWHVVIAGVDGLRIDRGSDASRLPVNGLAGHLLESCFRCQRERAGYLGECGHSREAEFRPRGPRSTSSS